MINVHPHTHSVIYGVNQGPPVVPLYCDSNRGRIVPFVISPRFECLHKLQYSPKPKVAGADSTGVNPGRSNGPSRG